ncbi:MAG TPA: gamma-glutamyltransferase [Gaiellaceae bacterium]|nr:gamma-glutamyltransferase [Gaiellaceae bacterium]
MSLPAGCAAGHPATAAAGVEILEDGGTAADAAVAASLASCVAETVMTGLLGGAHAIHYDAASGAVRNLDCFCAVPGLGAEPRDAELLELDVPFGEELVHYAVGPASCAVPGLPAGLGALWREHGRLPWARLVEPALRLAREGVPMPPAHVACLEMLAPVLTLDAGARIYAPGGSLLRPGERLDQPGLAAALESLAAEGAEGAYRGTIGEALLSLSDERGGLLTRADLDAYEARWADPAEVSWLGRRVLSRSGISGVPETLMRLPRLRGLSPAARVVALVAALDGGTGPETHTTNLVTVDAAGSACVLTSSLGLGSGDYLPGLDLHLNSMLGEVDLLVAGPLEPGARMASMMAPTVVLERERPVLAIGSAGGTRLRTALVTVAASVLDEGLEPGAAVRRPRVHPAGTVVNAEPGADEDGLAALEAAGRDVRRWPALHHYFGGASFIGRTGAAADPRRDGAALAARAAG